VIIENCLFLYSNIDPGVMRYEGIPISGLLTQGLIGHCKEFGLTYALEGSRRLQNAGAELRTAEYKGLCRCAPCRARLTPVMCTVHYVGHSVNHN